MASIFDFDELECQRLSRLSRNVYEIRPRCLSFGDFFSFRRWKEITNVVGRYQESLG
jgi:hypothetical protein